MIEAGQNLAHFRIIRRLGAGGMGEVYLAEDTKLGRNVALKLLTAEYFGDWERKERFYREAKTAAGISHSHVMAIFDIGSAVHPATGAEVDYIVMEYIEGTLLSSHLQTVGTDIKEVIRLAGQIAAGLAAAHKVNVVHRDIKADNVIIDRDNNAKILDFGLAKPVTPYQDSLDEQQTESISRELTKAGKIVGTVSYMSPEQIRGEAVDTRADIFSFGILLYRMATGSLPFEGETQVSTLAKILEARPEPPRLKNDHIPAELERIIDKCLQKNPDDRYQDTRDLVVDLRNLRRQFESGPSSITSGITDVVSGTKSRARRPWTSAVLTAAMLIVFAVILWQALKGPDSQITPVAQAGENALAILGFENKTGQDSLNWLQTGLPEILLTDLAQSQSLTIISRDRVIDCLAGGDRPATTLFSHPDCLNAARSLGAKHALSGTYYRLGGNFRIDARMEEIASGRILLTEKVVGTDLFAMVDSLTEKIAQSLHVEDEAVAATSVTAYTTSSPDAFRAYHLGMQKFEKELYEEAIAEFKQAITLDSTFAMSYMRIGMAYLFQGRQQDGIQWFSHANRYRDRLPNWERTQLDVYTDLWVNQEYDAAFIKMELLVRNHPQDKESRYIYGLLLQIFTHDTVKAYAQLDTALQLDPHYLAALHAYANFNAQSDNYDRAIELAQRAREAHPDSPTPYQLLGTYYTRLDDFERAITEYEEMLDAFPGNTDALASLGRIAIHARDFKKAAAYVERLPESHGGDPYIMADYWNQKANLEFWAGRFKGAMAFYFKALDQYLPTGDSNLIANQYLRIGSMYMMYGMTDSAVDYSRRAYEWGSLFLKIDYPIAVAQAAAPVPDSVVALFEDLLADFRSRLPSEIWPIADGIADLFAGYNRADTALIIDGYLGIYNASPSGNEGVKRAAGELAVRSGQFQRGKELLADFVSGKQMLASGFYYPYVLYHLGMAEEGLGNTAAAVAHYREMLTYWGRPDRELKEITDARARLARLTT